MRIFIYVRLTRRDREKFMEISLHFQEVLYSNLKLFTLLPPSLLPSSLYICVCMCGFNEHGKVEYFSINISYTFQLSLIHKTMCRIISITPNGISFVAYKHILTLLLLLVCDEISNLNIFVVQICY